MIRPRFISRLSQITSSGSRNKIVTRLQTNGKRPQIHATTKNPTDPDPIKEAGVEFAKLPRRTRIFLSTGLLLFALVGNWMTEKLEKKFPAPKPELPNGTPNDAEREKIIAALENGSKS